MEREEATSLATGTLKKVLASRGKLLGNFYYITDASAKEAVLVATLASKDKKGTRAVNQGRPFRKEIKGARYARGSVAFQRGKMVFTVHKGTANKKSMLDGLRNLLSKEKGLGFLKRAVVTMAGASEEELNADLLDGEAIDDDALQDADQSVGAGEVERLAAAQGDLAGLSAFFQADDAELEALFAQEVGEALGRLQAAQQKVPLDDAEQAEAWTELASLVAVGHDNLPQLGQDLPPELHQTLLAADSLIRGGDEGGDEQPDADLAGRLMAAMQAAERRYYAAGEPEGVAEWIVQAERLYDEAAYAEGLALLEQEAAWRLAAAERSRDVREEIEEATGGGVVELGRLLVEWRQAESAARTELTHFQHVVLSDVEVTADPRFSEIQPRVQALNRILPPSTDVESALNEYISAASPEERAGQRSVLARAVQGYASQIDADPRLQQLDQTAFGSFAVYSTLKGAVKRLRDHLSTTTSDA